MTKPDEPIALSAPLARRLATQLCRKDPVSGEDCSWYHGLWQDLRAIGLAAAPEHQADFFLNAFQRLANRRRRLRVLVSGAADYSILAYVLWACNAHRLAADVTVLDQCDTPLFLNNWYAERAGYKITTVRQDIFKYRPVEPFDVICSHSFLGQFPPDRRTDLIGKWSGFLTQGGTVLAVNRVRPNGAQRSVRFSPDEAQAFCATAEQKMRDLPSLTEADRTEILGRARIYVRRLQVFAMSETDLTTLLEQSGFRIDDLSSVVSTGHQDGRVSGLAIPNSAKHACVLATKKRDR